MIKREKWTYGKQRIKRINCCSGRDSNNNSEKIVVRRRSGAWASNFKFSHFVAELFFGPEFRTSNYRIWRQSCCSGLNFKLGESKSATEKRFFRLAVSSSAPNNFLQIRSSDFGSEPIFFVELFGRERLLFWELLLFPPPHVLACSVVCCFSLLCWLLVLLCVCVVVCFSGVFVFASVCLMCHCFVA